MNLFIHSQERQNFCGEFDIKDKKFRNRQGSNLRGHSPLDFKSNALTTRPRLPLIIKRDIF